MRNKFLYVIFLFQAFVLNLSNVVTPKYLDTLHVDKYLFGYFIALWSLGMMVSSPVWGRLGTQYGKKKFVLLGIVIYGISQTLFYYVENVPMLFLLRIVSGIGVGSIVTLLLSMMIINTDIALRPRELGRRMAALTLGNMIAYKISGVLGLTYTKELFLLQGLLSVCLFVFVLLGVSEIKKKSCVYPKQFDAIISLKYLKKLDRNVLLFLVSLTLTTMTFVNIDKFIDIFLVDHGHSVNVVGNVKLLFGLTLIVSNMVIIPRLKKYLGGVYILQTIAIAMGIIILIVFMDKDYLTLLCTIFLMFFVLKAIYTAGEQIYLSNLVDKSEMSLFMGLRQSFMCLGMVLGPIIGGHIYQQNEMNVFMFNVICLLVSSIILSVIRVEYSKGKSKNTQSLLS